MEILSAIPKYFPQLIKICKCNFPINFGGFNSADDRAMAAAVYAVYADYVGIQSLSIIAPYSYGGGSRLEACSLFGGQSNPP